MGSGRQLLYRRNRASPLIDLVDAIGNESALRVGGEGFRSEGGEGMMLEKIVLVEGWRPASVIRRLREEEMAASRRPFANPGEDRRPTLTWPGMFPIEGKPADVMKVVENYAAWLADTDVPKLFDQRRSRLDPGRPAAGTLPRLAEPDRSDGEGAPFRPGRQPRRDRPSGRRLRAPCTLSMNAPQGSRGATAQPPPALA